MSLAATQGNEATKEHLANLATWLTPLQRSEGQRLAQEWEARRAEQIVATKEPVEEKPREEEVEEEESGHVGTGFMITRDGYLVTNHHVVAGGGKILVRAKSFLLAAEIVRVDITLDLALLKIVGDFDALPVVSSREARLGATVATVGFPNVSLQGFEPKLTKGEISGLSGIQDDVKYFQISVPVQPGNSGGALFDERGNVVGVVTAQLSQAASLATTGTLAQNVNYAVKSSYLLGFLEASPEVGTKMSRARTGDLKFEDVVEDVKKATVFVISSK